MQLKNHVLVPLGEVLCPHCPHLILVQWSHYFGRWTQWKVEVLLVLMKLQEGALVCYLLEWCHYLSCISPLELFEGMLLVCQPGMEVLRAAVRGNPLPVCQP